MTRTFTNSLAALAAAILTITSISTIVAVPPASAHSVNAAGAIVELA